MVVALIDKCDVDIDITEIVDSLQSAETSADDDQAVLACAMASGVQS